MHNTLDPEFELFRADLWGRLGGAAIADSAAFTAKDRRPGRDSELATGQAVGGSGSYVPSSSEDAIVRTAVRSGETNENALTDLVFFRRYPTRGRRPISANEPNYRQLSQEWLRIRDTLVRPNLRGPPPTGTAGLPFGIQLPTARRRLDPVLEEPRAKGVYGGSLLYTDIWISDSLGAGGRPWTIWTPLGCVMNLGSVAYRSPGSNSSLLIHELAHCWQSQHHPSPVAFMANSVASQAAAAAAGGSAYCYRPGKSFGSYAAEQNAQQVQNGEPAIVAHVASVPAGAVDGANVRSLFVPRWETPGIPGVRC